MIESYKPHRHDIFAAVPAMFYLRKRMSSRFSRLFCRFGKDAAQVRLVTSTGLIAAKVVKVDVANDLAVLKAEGRFAALPVAASRGVKLGGTFK